MSNIIIFENWLDSLDYLSKEERIEYIGCVGILRRGESLDIDKEVKSNSVKIALKNNMTMILRANQAREENRGVGRPRTIGDYEIWQCCRENPGCTAAQVAEILGVSASKVNHSQGWAKRRNEFWF